MRLLDEIAGIVSSKLILWKNIFELLKLETRLASLSIGPLLFGLVALLVLLMSTWTLMLVLVVAIFYSLMQHFLYSVAITLCLNFLCLFGIYRLIKIRLRQMSFEKTRAYFSNEASHERAPATDLQYCKGVKDISVSSN